MRIRVLLIDMPRLLRDIIRRALADDQRFELVGEYGSEVALDLAVDRSRADYVIVGTDVFEARDVLARLLVQGPQVRVLAVRPEGGQTFLYELRPHEDELGDVPVERLLDVMVAGASERARAAEAGA